MPACMGLCLRQMKIHLGQALRMNSGKDGFEEERQVRIFDVMNIFSPN